jgi:hypothetical protein
MALLSRRKQWIMGAFAGLVSAAIPLWLLRGFTVDDALIPARYAAHLAHGLGYRFNPHGPVTDGVTPLGWAHLLVPFARGGVLPAFEAARAIGTGAWLVASAWLGMAVQASGKSAVRWAALGLVLVSAPLGAWAASGMETGVALALATAAVCLRDAPGLSGLGGGLAGLVAWLRPEALPFALVLGLGRARSATSTCQRLLALGGAAAPFVVVAITRAVVFGRPYPLALSAKPSDLAHGAAYAAAALLLSGGPIAAAGPFLVRSLPRWPRVLVGSVLAHGVAIALAGGDWMPLSRLVVPVVPALVLIVAHALGSRPRTAGVALALAVVLELVTALRVGPAASRVLATRTALIDATRPRLHTLSPIATVDAGWVGACADTEVVDLSGVTDPEIAALAGGHTSKRITLDRLRERRVAGVLVWIGADSQEPRRAVEKRLVLEMGDTYELAWTSPADLPTRYALYTPR